MSERIFPEDPAGLLPMFQEQKGFYLCPKDGEGKRLGPLVGYAGRDEHGKNLVGDAYFNYAMIEEWPGANVSFAEAIGQQIVGMGIPDQIFGMPMGGLFLSYAVAEQLHCRVGFMEKVVLTARTGTSREVSRLVFGRHGPANGDEVVLIEDVINNFSTTERAILECLEKGASVLAIACAVNRSFPLREEFECPGRGLIPVIAAITAPTPQWRQSDSEVEADIIAGNVVWKPKLEWSRLEAAMASSPQEGEPGRYAKQGAPFDEPMEDDSFRAEGPSYG